MNINNTVWELDGESGNFSWFVKRYIEQLVEEKFTSTNTGSQKLLDELEALVESGESNDRTKYIRVKEIFRQLRAGA